MPETGTREQILDAAETLISNNGYANTSLREVTSEAGANVAAVNYHFGSKEGMVCAMLDRRLTPLNRQRLMLLEKELELAEEQNRKPDARIVLRAFVEPAIRFILSQAGGKHFLRLFSRIHADPDDTIRKAFVQHMAPVFKRFFESLSKALPQVPPKNLAPRLFFCIGAMGQGAGMLVDEELLERGSELGLPSIPDPETMIEELIGFVTRGMEDRCDG